MIFFVDRIAKLTHIYDADFSPDDLVSLAKKMFELERNIMFPRVYRIIELGLLLPMVTASVERVFSVMKIINTKLRNKMADAWLNDLMVCYIERGLFKGLGLAEIKKEYQKKNRRMPLPRSVPK
jgi:hypothetical protein